MTEQDELAGRIRKAIGPTMLLGLQDADLHDESGRQRIKEWVDWIAGAIVPLVADEVNTEVERIRAAVTEGKSIGRPLTASDVRVAHEVTRKQLAGALDAGLHLNWPQLVAEAQRSHAANAAWMADVQRARDLHSPVQHMEQSWCQECSVRRRTGPHTDEWVAFIPHPCPTIEALENKEPTT